MQSRVLLNYNKFCVFIKNTKKRSLASNCWEYTNFCLKGNAVAVSKNYITQENIRFLGVKKDYETSTKRQISNYKLYKLFKN